MNDNNQDLVRAEKFLLFMLSLIKERRSTTYPNSIFYMKGDKVLFEFDTKGKVLWVHYSKIWSVFESKYGLEYQQIRALVKKVVENTLKLEGITPIAARDKLTWKVENTLKFEGFDIQ